MRRVSLARRLLLGALLGYAGAAVAAGVEVVHRSDDLQVAAGIEMPAGEPVVFGVPLRLQVMIDYDPERVALLNADDSLFAAAWSPAAGVHLTAWDVALAAGEDGYAARAHASFEFQVLGCPDATKGTCPGLRVYPVPTFTLEYADPDAAGQQAQTLRFRPRPRQLQVAMSLELDEDSQLHPFEHYFPDGGFPEPATGADGTRGALLTAGAAVLLLTGGIVMWPFRSRSSTAATAAEARWREQLRRLAELDPEDEARYLDQLRRALVWYCNDELDVDPFIWLDLAEPGDEADTREEAAEEHTDLRALFVDILHCPAGQAAELRSRFERLVATAAG